MRILLTILTLMTSIVTFADEPLPCTPAGGGVHLTVDRANPDAAIGRGLAFPGNPLKIGP